MKTSQGHRKLLPAAATGNERRVAGNAQPVDQCSRGAAWVATCGLCVHAGARPFVVFPLGGFSEIEHLLKAIGLLV
jgi:hypothetical protein